MLAQHMLDPWPINPFTGTDMKPGTERGDYQYTVSASKKHCTVAARLSDGRTYAPQALQIQ